MKVICEWTTTYLEDRQSNQELILSITTPMVAISQVLLQYCASYRASIAKNNTFSSKHKFRKNAPVLCASRKAKIINIASGAGFSAAKLSTFHKRKRAAYFPSVFHEVSSTGLGRTWMAYLTERASKSMTEK